MRNTVRMHTNVERCYGNLWIVKLFYQADLDLRLHSGAEPLHEAPDVQYLWALPISS